MWSSKERDMSKFKEKFKIKIICWICNNEGYMKKDCPKQANDGVNVVNPS